MSAPPPASPLRRLALDDVPPLALTLVTLVMTWLLFRFFMVPYSLQVNFDEGGEAAAVERVLSGRGLPYVDASAIRGPFLYWTQAAMHLITGRFEYTGTRALALVSALVTVLSTFLGGWAARWPLAGAIGGLVYVFVITTVYDPGGGMGVVAESVAIAYITTAVALVGYALYRARTERTRVALLAGGGFIIAMAALTKQTEGIVVGPMCLWIAARAAGDGVDASQGGRPPWGLVLKRRLLPFATGGLLLVGLVLLRYALARELSTFFFWSTGFGVNVYMQPYKGQVAKLVGQWFIDQPWAIFGVALAAAVGLGRPLAAIRAPGRGILAGLGDSAFELMVGLMAIALLLAAAMPLRIWPHYFMAVYPFFGLVVGILIERLLRAGDAVPWPGGAAAAVVLGSLLITSGSTRLVGWKRQRAQGAWVNPRPDRACSEIDRLAGEGRAGIFVWGSAGDLYITCKRPSVSMFTATMLVAGIIPPFWNPDPARAAPHATEILVRELDAGRPPVILDYPMAAGASMMDMPVLADYVNARYCRTSNLVDGRGRSMTFYARKDLSACRERSP